jgi:putative DNA primase/helicase
MTIKGKYHAPRPIAATNGAQHTNGQTNGAAPHDFGDGPVWDFSTATRDEPTFRAIRDKYPDFDLATHPDANAPLVLVWRLRCQHDASAVQEGIPLDDMVERTLRGLLPTNPNAAPALSWLKNPKATFYKSTDAQSVARKFIKNCTAPKGQSDFPNLSADQIPSATIITTKGDKEELSYDPAVLVTLLYPHWKTVAPDTETAHARRICELLGDDLLFCSKLGFLLWNNRHWETDDRHATGAATRVSGIAQRIRVESAALYALAGTLAKNGRTDDARAMGKAALSHLKHAKNTEARRFISESLKLAAGAEEIKIAVEAFDQKPWRLGFQNGVWDKGEWREHRRDDFALSLCSLDVDFDFDQSEWLQVLERITGADADFARTLQEMVGYILSGASHLRLIPWLYGPKGTGKSTLAELIQTVLGKMAQTIDPKKLQDDAARERLGADLWNRRLAVCAEAGSQKLEAELLKTLSGGDTLTVRFLYQEAFNAVPRHVLMMVSNDAPRLDAYDDALKDRVVALPFVHPLGEGAALKFTGHTRIESARQDPQSPLVRGFIVWALEGLKAVYHSQTVFRAECLAEATANFWADTDPVTPFWKTVDENQLRAGIPKAELRRRYENWCACEGAKPLAARNWTRACISQLLREGWTTEGARTWKK